jgi:hypothetical protein
MKITSGLIVCHRLKLVADMVRYFFTFGNFKIECYLPKVSHVKYVCLVELSGKILFCPSNDFKVAKFLLARSIKVIDERRRLYAVTSTPHDYLLCSGAARRNCWFSIIERKICGSLDRLLSFNHSGMLRMPTLL